ncbi:MAG TPA: hypothetical protein VGD67_10595 [Pseudonocardiaceae bacterium]
MTAPGGNPPPTRQQLRAIQQAVDDARLSAQASVRNYRNVLLAVAAVSVLCAVALPPAQAYLSADLLLIHLPEAGAQAGADTTPRRATAGDLATIEAWGLLGGLISAVAGMRRMRGSRDPAGLHLAQLALKLPAGALTAVFGIVLLQAEIVPPLARIGSDRIAAFAILFGFAQEAFTVFVDRRSEKMLADAGPLTSPGEARAA